MDSNTRLQTALDTVKRWMIANEAPLLVENLAQGATPSELDAAEATLGFPLPSDLRALWSLHNGQVEQLNGFVEYFDLFGIAEAQGEQEGALMFVEFVRERPQDWEEAGVSADEVGSDAWVPLAGRDSDYLVVSGVSGRVFACGKGSSPLERLADSITEWAERYARRVAAGEYKVEEGFGDYYLELRDLEEERREAEETRLQQQEERYRRETPPLTQVRDALARDDAEACGEVFERLAEEKNDEALTQAAELLLAAGKPPAFVATALRVSLNSVSLTPKQWKIVARGGEELGNNAIRDIAAQRATAGHKPWWKFW